MPDDAWFEVVAAEASLTQGDLVADCPLLGWKREAAAGFDNSDAAFDLANLARTFSADVVVMTQACDLEQKKVSDAVLCPALSLAGFRTAWERQRQAAGQAPTPKAWSRELGDIASGRVWNLSLLNSFHEHSAATEIRVVYFDRVFTLPREFLEGLLRRRGGSRLRLRSPYREHLSQSFARFFMRVGLPLAIELPSSYKWPALLGNFPIGKRGL